MSVVIRKSNKKTNCYFINGKSLVIDKNLDLNDCGYVLTTCEIEVVNAIKHYKLLLYKNIWR